jgi:hypothetical protein
MLEWRCPSRNAGASGFDFESGCGNGDDRARMLESVCGNLDVGMVVLELESQSSGT